MGGTGYYALLNSCQPIATTDPVSCLPGTIACQQLGSSPYRAMAKTLGTATSNGPTLVDVRALDGCPRRTVVSPGVAVLPARRSLAHSFARRFDLGGHVHGRRLLPGPVGISQRRDQL